MRRPNSVLDAGALRRDRRRPRARSLDDPTYNVNGANDTQRPGCKAPNWADQAGNDDHYSPYWKQRNLIPGAKGSKVPLFLTQGLTENNTVADGMAQYMQNHTGYERAWLGPWDHVRGNETDDDGTPADGPRGLVRRGHALLRPLPQGREADGRGPDDRRADQRRQVARRGRRGRPPTRAGTRARCAPARYTDDGTAARPARAPTTGIWTISPPLPYDAHLAGSGRVDVDVPRRCRGATSSSTSTTSTRPARAR